MAEPIACPTRDELERMVLGQLADEAATRIEQHLDRCAKCWSALDQCVASDEFLERARTSRPTSCEPTKTLHVPIQWIRSALSTWVRSHDCTQPDKTVFPLPMAEIKGLLSPPQAADEIGRVAEFRVLRVLGVGGMAVVFEAEDSRLKRRVALKLMLPAIASKPGAAERFLREAQSAAALKHEHVVTIYQVGMHGETPFIALELLHGETLEDYLLRHDRISVQEVIRIGREIATGLGAAHARGLLHRDIKPANIWLERPETPVQEQLPPANYNQGSHSGGLLEPSGLPIDRDSAGRVKILDFGLAKAWTDESGISYPGLLIGTPAYMAPEQLAGTTVDPRADLFSLGCVLYRMTSGQLPFGSGNVLSVVRALALEEPAPARAFNPQVPQPLSDLIAALLSKSPDQRPASAQAVVGQLLAVEQQLPLEGTVEKPVQVGPPTNGGARRGGKTGWRTGAVVAVVVSLPLLYLLFGAQLIRVVTNKGQVVIEIDDPTVEVTVKEGLIVIQDGLGAREITLAAGDHQLAVTVKQASGETTFKTDRFTLSRGGRKVIAVREELNRVAALPSDSRQKLAGDKTRAATTKDQVPPVQAATTPDRQAADWVLSLGGFVILREGRDGKPIAVGRGGDLPVLPFDVIAVRLETCEATDAGLEHLRGLTHLAELYLNGTRVTDSGLGHLVRLPSLRVLDLSGLPLTDAGLATACKLKTLRNLVVIHTQVTDAGLKHLKNLTDLDTLYLGETRITDAGLVHLQGLKNLRVLGLSKTFVTNAGLVPLAGLSQLEVLYLNETQVTDGGLAHLAGLTALKTLSLTHTAVSDVGLQHVEGLNNLRILVLEKTRIGDAGLAHVQHLTALNALDLTNTAVTDVGLKQLYGLTKLQSLRLNGTRVTDVGLTGI
ncbi:MAG TPA: protein kinase, partial [Planctomycetaceae bacterium]|nr:protein kinase [Planctomycetaceae bacterium]